VVLSARRNPSIYPFQGFALTLMVRFTRGRKRAQGRPGRGDSGNCCVVLGWKRKTRMIPFRPCPCVHDFQVYHPRDVLSCCIELGASRRDYRTSRFLSIARVRAKVFQDGSGTVTAGSVRRALIHSYNALRRGHCRSPISTRQALRDHLGWRSKRDPVTCM